MQEDLENMKILKDRIGGELKCMVITDVKDKTTRDFFNHITGSPKNVF